MKTMDVEMDIRVRVMVPAPSKPERAREKALACAERFMDNLSVELEVFHPTWLGMEIGDGPSFQILGEAMGEPQVFDEDGAEVLK